MITYGCSYHTVLTPFLFLIIWGMVFSCNNNFAYFKKYLHTFKWLITYILLSICSLDAINLTPPGIQLSFWNPECLVWQLSSDWLRARSSLLPWWKSGQAYNQCNLVGGGCIHGRTVYLCLFFFLTLKYKLYCPSKKVKQIAKERCFITSCLF